MQYKPYHLIGLELGISIANIMCRGEPTGQCQTFAADTVATAKRDLKAGETLDGEGGFMVYGKLMPAEASLAIEGLPIGLAHGLVLLRDVQKDRGLSWRDVEWSVESQVVAVRREMEDLYRKEFSERAKGVNGSLCHQQWSLSREPPPNDPPGGRRRGSFDGATRNITYTTDVFSNVWTP